MSRRNKKYTNEEIDLILIPFNIKRLENYVSIKSKTKWLCEKCQFIWEVPADGILTGRSGCPNCAGNMKLTNEIVDERLKNRNIKRIGNYIGNSSKLEFECCISTCANRWPALPSSIFYGRGCPKCGAIKRANSNRKTNEEFDTAISTRLLKRLDDYIDDSTKIRFQCSVETCKHIWPARPTNILQNKGCPMCKHKNEKLVHTILSKYNILFLHHYSINLIDKIECKKFMVDFYLPSHNLIIEYNGDQHYRPIRFDGMSIVASENKFIKQKKRDLYVEKFCNNHNIDIIWIDGRVFEGNMLMRSVEDLLIPYILEKNEIKY